LNTPHSSEDADVRFALAWLALYFMLIAGGLAGEREFILHHVERLSHTVCAPIR
jgi:hypothetical protein